MNNLTHFNRMKTNIFYKQNIDHVVLSRGTFQTVYPKTIFESIGAVNTENLMFD
jgi:hypothetical protein